MRLPIKPYLVRLYLAAFAYFFVNKFLLRPIVTDAQAPRWLDIVVYSSPNLVEAILGMTVVATVLMLGLQRYWRDKALASDTVVYTVAALLVGAYVLTQEFKLHNLGGRNVYDPIDALASGVGVLMMWAIFCRFGVLDTQRMPPRTER